MNTILLASRNPHKISELRRELRPLGIELRSSADYPDLDEVVEDRDTLEGNALKKARRAQSGTGLPALADDTGLEIEALGGRPGVRSARFAGEGATDEENLEKLLAEMKDVEQPDRGARFRTVVAFVTPDYERTFEGICRGRILREPRGEKGFGYDPVFLPEGGRRTFAELEGEQKNNISHRGRAVRAFLEWLKQQA